MATATATAPTTTGEDSKKRTKDVPVEDTRPPKPTMPYVELGQVVRWYMDGKRSCEPHAAIVTTIGHNSLGVLALNPQGGYMLREGVKHVDDEAMKEADREEGAWEHTRLNRALLDLTGLDWEYRPATNNWK